MAINTELTSTARRIHWVAATVILTLIVMGFYMVRIETWGLYEWHKSLGLLALVLILMRIVYRLRRGWPQPVRQYPRHERVASQVVHWLLLVGILVMPLTGMSYSGASGHGFGIWGWTLMPENHGAAGVEPRHEALSLWAQQAHGFLGYVLAGVIVLHLLGALKHHFLDKDNTLRRMLGRT